MPSRTGFSANSKWVHFQKAEIAHQYHPKGILHFLMTLSSGIAVSCLLVDDVVNSYKLK